MLPDDQGSDHHAGLIGRLVAGDPSAPAEVLALAAACDDLSLLVIAAVVSGERAHLVRAGSRARTARERQLVVLADAHLRGDASLLDALVREHLAEYPDHLLAAWIAGRPRYPTSKNRS